MPKLNPDQRAQIADAIASGARYKDIAVSLGVNANTVTYHAKQLGYAPRRTGPAPKLQPVQVPAGLTIPQPSTFRGTSAWMEEGSCRGIDDPDVMHPQYARDIPAAKAVCEPCPVRTRCLEWALTHREPHGVWGGMDEQEREAVLLQQTEATAC